MVAILVPEVVEGRLDSRRWRIQRHANLGVTDVQRGHSDALTKRLVWRHEPASVRNLLQSSANANRMLGRLPSPASDRTLSRLLGNGRDLAIDRIERNEKAPRCGLRTERLSQPRQTFPVIGQQSDCQLFGATPRLSNFFGGLLA